MNNTPEQETALQVHRKMLINCTYPRYIYTQSEADEAVRARITGEFDNVQLQRIGRLSNDANRDILFIRNMTRHLNSPFTPLYREPPGVPACLSPTK